MKATLVRAGGRARPRRHAWRVSVRRVSCCCCRRPRPICSRYWVQSRAAWRGTIFKFDRAGLADRGEARPAADAVADSARHLQRHRPLHDRQPGRAGRCRKIYRGPRPGSPDPDDAGDERCRRVFSARRQDPRQSGRRRGAVASRRMRRAAAQHHAAGLPRLRGDFPACRQCHSRRRFPRAGRGRPCRSWRSP